MIYADMQVKAIKHISKWGQVHGYTKIDNDHILSVDGASLCVIPDEYFILDEDRLGNTINDPAIVAGVVEAADAAIDIKLTDRQRVYNGRSYAIFDNEGTDIYIDVAVLKAFGRRCRYGINRVNRVDVIYVYDDDIDVLIGAIASYVFLQA